jgi:hypothetical protein
MKYVNDLFPVGNFYRTHKMWDGEKYSVKDHLMCFLGKHVKEFRLFGITNHCACCGYYHNTTLKQRLNYLKLGRHK